jgi:hypothetical protein
MWALCVFLTWSPMKNLSFVLIFIFLLSGCVSTPTEYQEYASWGGGYTDYDLSEEDSPYKKHSPDYDFAVSVYLNGDSDLKRAFIYAQKRAAELSKTHGYEYFTFKTEYFDYIRKKWSGGGVSGVALRPRVVILIKFESSNHDLDKKVHHADTVLKKMDAIYPHRKNT